MKFTHVWGIVALILLSSTQFSHATVLAKGNDTNTDNNKTFLAPVQATLFDRPSATFFATIFGTDSNGNAIVNGAFTISKAQHTLGQGRPIFQGIAPANIPTTDGQAIQNSSITIITLATSEGNNDPKLAFILDPVSLDNSTPKRAFIISDSGKTTDRSEILLDSNGQETAAISNIAANNCYVFAAVLPQNPNPFVCDYDYEYMCDYIYDYDYEGYFGPVCSLVEELVCNQVQPPVTFGFGELGSGIALVGITPKTLELQQVPAVSNSPDIKAKLFDPTIPQIRFGIGVPNINPFDLLATNDARMIPYPQMVWDDKLQRLFVGFDARTANTGLSGARSVVTVRVQEECETLEYSAFAPGSAFTAGTIDNIIGVLETNLGPESLSVHRLAVMHASTGPSYLIVNGDSAARPLTGRNIYALPLVDNPSQITTHGTLANKNSALSGGKFIVPATVNADLTTNTDPAALVGGGPFPLSLLDTTLSDLVVVGDTVYASSNVPCKTTDDEVGVFYSQAMFDETGKIIRWTPWTKRSFPFDGFVDGSCKNVSPQVSFFEVDASTGKVWAVGGKENKTVRVTAWGNGAHEQGLVAQVNEQLTDGKCMTPCYSVLDLDQSTRGFLGTDKGRYALFGATNKVIFAQVSKACGDAINSPQQVITDYTKPENLLCTKLDACSAVTVLEYSRRDNEDCETYPYNCSNYFYAGTKKGLYVFADENGNALDMSSFGDLNQPPFSTGQWHKIETINGAVIDIKTLGNELYVLTFEPTCTDPLQGKLYEFSFEPNINMMFSASAVENGLIAQTNNNEFESIARFLAIQLVSVQHPFKPEQRLEYTILATNRGLFQRGYNNPWEHIPASGTHFYPGIGSMHTSVPSAPPSTVWPFSIQDEKGCKTFDRGSIHQLANSQ